LNPPCGHIHPEKKVHLLDRAVSTTLARFGQAIGEETLWDEWQRVLTWPYACFRMRQHLLHGKPRKLPRIWDIDFQLEESLAPEEKWKRFCETQWECDEIPAVRTAVDEIVVDERDHIFAHRLREIHSGADNELCVAIMGKLHLDNVARLVDQGYWMHKPDLDDLLICPMRSIRRRLLEYALLRRVKTTL